MGDRGRAADRGGKTSRVASEHDRTLLNAVDDGIYQLDADGNFISVNDAIVEKTGYPRDELLDEHVSKLIDSQTVALLRREIRTRLETGVDDETTFDVVIETADGSRLPCELRFSLLVTDGEYDGTVGIVREADDRGRAHDELASIWERHTTISSVIDEADVGVFVLDSSFDVAWIDESIEEYFGLDRADVIGRDKRTLIDETIRDRVAEPNAFEEIVLSTYDDNSSVEQFECQITAGDDRESRWLEHRSRPIESGLYGGGRIELYYDITDRKNAEQARSESEQQFTSLINAVEEYAIFRLDPDGRVISWNPGARQIKGYEDEDVLGEHFSVFYTESDRAAGVPETNLERARTNGVAGDEGWRVRADGSRFWANVTLTAIRDEGELEGYAKVTRDMTDRREREQQLQRERNLIEQILETSSVGIAVVNPDGTTSRTNERMANLFGFSADESEEPAYTVGQRDLFDANGTALPVDERPANRVFETGEPVYDQEVRVELPSGRCRWVSINATPLTDERGEPAQAVLTVTDITDLKELANRRKRELQERERELTAVQLATDLLEPDAKPVDELLAEFASNLPQAFRHSEQTAARVAIGDHEATTDGYDSHNRTITARTRTANGTPITIDVALAELFPESDPDSNSESDSDVDSDRNPNPEQGPRPDSEPDRKTETDFDEEQELIDTLVTLVKFYFERREYIDELQLETSRLEQFAYAASHDLQEPLRMISSYLQLLERRYEDVLDEEGAEFLNFAVDGAERMREMIDGLLAYSRVKTQGTPLEPVDLNAVLDDVLADLEVRIAEADAEITAESLPTVEGDASQLRQLFQNLVDNAIEYTDEDPRIHVSATERDAEWVVSVRDNGIGIEPGLQDEIFEVFERLHSRDEYAGTGIGLALCQRIVERHGGEIWVDSEPGAGSTFSFTLPGVDDADGEGEGEDGSEYVTE